MKTTSLTCDVLVIGAGPAGLAAALAARQAGADVICLDLFARAGGQYHMQPPTPHGPFEETPQVRGGRDAEARCREAGVRFLLQTEVFWAEPGFTVFASQADAPVTIRCSALVAATGAMERALPFKGWTLPGVITAGGAQRLIKANKISPGRNVVLAGTGPFLLAVASTFATAGQNLRAYVEMQTPRLSALPLLLGHPSRLAEAAKLASHLWQARPSLLTGHRVIEALGTSRIEAVRVAPLTKDGSLHEDRAFLIDDVDCLCVSYGFRPVIDITSLLGAQHRFDDSLGGWICNVDAAQETTVARLFAAGETTGIGGAVPAHLSGRVAGLHAAAAVGHSAAGDEVAALQSRLHKARRFAAGLSQLFPFPGHLVEELDATEKVCRCEDVSVDDIRTAIEDGATDAFSVKMWTRAGMGPCQGRVCGSAVAELIARQLRQPVAETGYNRPHLPLRPVPLSLAEAALAGAEEND